MIGDQDADAAAPDCGLDRAPEAVLADLESAGLMEDSFRSFFSELDALGVDLTQTSMLSDAVAKAGRVLSAANERRLREALATIQGALDDMAGTGTPPEVSSGTP